MTQTTSTDLITAELAATVANAFESPESLEAFVDRIPLESAPIYIAKTLDSMTNARAFIKGLERRLNAEHQVGNHWIIDGQRYGFYGALQRDWKKGGIPNLIDNLLRLGISPRSLADAISDLRVTDLRQMVTVLTDPEDRAAALELIEGARVEKGERGEPRFQAIDEKYVSSK